MLLKTESEINAIMKFQEVEQPSYQTSFSVGEAVKITDGAFADFIGSVEEIDDTKDLPEHTKKEIQAFFEDYKKLEEGKFVKITGWGRKEEAEKMIREAIERYKEFDPKL